MIDPRATPLVIWRTRLASRTLAALCPVFAAALAETVCIVVRTPNNAARIGFSLGVFAQCQLVALLFGLFVSALSLALSGLLALLREQRVLGFPMLPRALDFAAAALLIAPLGVLALYSLFFELATGTKNRELALLASAVLAFGGACLALLSWLALTLAVSSMRRRLAAAPAAIFLIPGALSSVAVVSRLSASAGLSQLDPWLLAAPAAAFAGVPVAARLARVLTRGRPPLITLGMVAAVSLLAALASLATPASAAKAFRAGAWSRPVISLLRRLSDFDHDGYSGFLGGGDCAPFDASVHPGAAELPLDGVDNNCVGGDGGRSAPAQSRSIRYAAPNAGRKLNLVLVTIETLRADHVSVLGYTRPTTPRLTELGRSSVVFERSYATTPTTRLSVAALLSGRLPSSLHWLRQDREKQMRRLASDTPWLPALLSERGYTTLAVHTNFRAFTQVENAGFARGFARYDTSTELSYSGGTMQGFPGGAQVDRALALLDEAAGRPVFLWLHLLEPHYLYEQSPHVPRFGDDDLARYDADIAEADRQVGRLMDGLRARDLFESSVLFVTGDHGEEFGEHGQRWHGSNLYEPQLRTATLLRVPGLLARRVAEPVSFLDFAPTVLDFLGVGAELAGAMGRDLAALLVAGRSLEPGFLVENFKVDDGSQALLGVVDWPWKLVRMGPDASLELYDLSRDPGEIRDLWLADEPVSRRLGDRLYQYLESGEARGVSHGKDP